MGNLSARAVDSLGPGRHSDGDGLYLEVKPSGRRSWILRVQVEGRRRDIGLGSIAKLSLKEARAKSAELRKHALNGRDPVAERDRRAFTPKTFRDAAKVVHAAKSVSWSIKTAEAFKSTLAEHAYPTIGDMLVEDIDAADVVRVLAPLWQAKPATAAKVRQHVGAVLAYAKASKWRTTEAPVKSVSVLLGKRGQGEAMASMPYREVPAFFSAQWGKEDALGRLALLFLVATAARSGEVRAAQWSQIDLDTRLWTRPAAIMKSRRAHTVTLNDAAVAILERVALLRPGQEGLVFPSAAGGGLSDNTLSKVMRDARLPFVPHGFRSSFRDWAAETVPTIPDPVAEAALAHAVPDKIVAAYKRTQFLEMRRKLLDEWGAYIAGPGLPQRSPPS